jgi:hypothetical protein
LNNQDIFGCLFYVRVKSFFLAIIKFLYILEIFCETYC